MARIRTIKPEFPKSESMGRVSRDARLLFIQLWTLCDDSGRTRAASRMLASLLYPYDDDAPKLIDAWLGELQAEGCIEIYKADGQTYLQVLNWLKHQKIDKPSQSKIPSFDESSRILANPREVSSEDQGPRTKDQGEESPPKPPKGGITFASYAEQQKALGQPLLPEGHNVFRYAESIKLPERYLYLAWCRFRDHHLELPKRQKDWPGTFRRYVENNYLRLWYKGDEGWGLTTTGRQAELKYKEGV